MSVPIFHFFEKNRDRIILYLILSFTASLLWFKESVNTKVLLFMAFVFFCDYFISKMSRLSFLKQSIINHKWMLFLFLLFMISMLWTVNIEYGLIRAQKLVSLLVFPILFGLIQLKQFQIKLFKLGFIIIVLLACFYSHTLVVIKFLIQGETEFRNFFNLNYSYTSLSDTINTHTTYYSLFILVAVIFLLDYVKNNFTYKNIFTGILLYGYFSIFILQLGTRSCLAILYFISIFYFIVFIKKSIRKWVPILMLLILHVAGILIISKMPVISYRIQQVVGFTYYTGYTVNDGEHKLELWEAAIDANSNMLIGNGIGDHKGALLKAYQKYDLKKPFERKYNSHNQYIEIYGTLGIIGLLVFLFFIIHYAVELYRKNGLLGFSVVLTVALLCITECLFNRHKGIVLIVFLFCILSANRAVIEQSEQ